MEETKMEYTEILNYIDSIQSYSDETIEKNLDYIIQYLHKIGRYDLERKIKLISIKTIRDFDKKVNLIKKYFYIEQFGIMIYNWYSITKILENSSDQTKKEVIKKLMANVNFEPILNYLNIPNNLKFGVELEYYGVSFEIIQKLFKIGIMEYIFDSISVPKKTTDNMIKKIDFEKENQFDKWVFSKECDRDYMPEASSPIMTNTLNDLNQIKAILMLFEILGAKNNDATGLHINIGADYFLQNENAIKKLLIIWSECEELFYKITNEENKEIRSFAKNMAIPIKENIQKTLTENKNIKLDNQESFEEFIYNIQVRERLSDMFGFSHGELELELMKAKSKNDKYNIFKKYMKEKSKTDESIKFTSINFSHINWNKTDKGRIEFRLFNSTLSMEIIMQNILLIGKLFETSFKLANDNNYKRQEFNDLLNHNVTEEHKLNLLLNLLFDDEKEKQIFKLRWNSVKNKSIYDNFKTGEDTFFTEEEKIKNLK